MTVQVKGCLRACLLPDPEGAGKGVTLHTPLRTKGTVDLGGYRILPQLARRLNDTKAEQTMMGLSEKRWGVKSSTYCPPVYEEHQEVCEDPPCFFGVGLFVEVSVQVAELWREVKKIAISLSSSDKQQFEKDLWICLPDLNKTLLMIPI